MFLTFLICFILVVTVKLAVLGVRSLKKKPEEKPKPPPKAEPVYYIVEKRRTKSQYSDPKEIKFKK